MVDILLTTINAKWIHPSLALRLLKANLGALEPRSEIIEFALRQPLAEKLKPFSVSSVPPCPRVNSFRVIGISVSIWNHLATIELLAELEKIWAAAAVERPVIVLGGPEVSHLPPEAEIFKYADHVIRGEGEVAFRVLCEKILAGDKNSPPSSSSSSVSSVVNILPKFIEAGNVNLSAVPHEIKSAYHLYSDAAADLAKKLIYVESSRGCPFKCEFCLSAVTSDPIREFPLEPFLAEMDELVNRGVKTFKFLDRTFNANIKRAQRIMEFFLEKIEKQGNLQQAKVQQSPQQQGLNVHFEMVPSLFPLPLMETLTRFPPGTLRLEIGIQTFNPEVAARISRPVRPEKELETLRFLREKTNAIIHADLIAGLPGEDLASFGKGFDILWQALYGAEKINTSENQHVEIQLGILKLLPGAPISRHNETFGMCYNPLPPYEVVETSAMSAQDIQRIKNFARFWTLLEKNSHGGTETRRDFESFMALSDQLYAKFGRNWGIDKNELLEAVDLFNKPVNPAISG